jgi:hypothetical protein
VFRPRARKVLAAALLVATGGVAMWVTSNSPSRTPLHFWVRDGAYPVRMFDAPGGHEIAGWHCRDVWVPGERSDLHTWIRDRGVVASILASFGLRSLTNEGFTATSLHADAGARPGWRECFVTSLSDFPDGTLVHPELEGTWQAEDRSATPRVLEDGWWRDADAPPPGTLPRRGNVGDLMLVERLGSGSFVDVWLVLSDDRTSGHDIDGTVWHKVK